MASYFLPFRPKTTTLQQSNSHMVTSTVKQREIQIFHTKLNRVEALITSKHRKKHNASFQLRKKERGLLAVTYFLAKTEMVQWATRLRLAGQHLQSARLACLQYYE